MFAQGSNSARKPVMKPTFQSSRQTRLTECPRPLANASKSPVTDWEFQASAPETRGGSSSFRHEGQPAGIPSFHRLSERFIRDESKRDSRLEAGAFVVMIALAAWPIGLAVQAAITLAK